jgi:DNA-3-methyladenine glycosylase
LKPDSVLKLPVIQAAPLLLGWILSRQLPEGMVKLKIVETEAYHQEDPASHSYKWRTARTAPMFKAGGHIYVYFTYGMHYAIKIVVGAEGVGEGVLLRAAEPIEGIEILAKNRGISDIKKLASGPGRLTQAIGITDTSLSGKILNKSSILLEPPREKLKSKDIIAGPRIGISQNKDVPWRFYIKNNPFVSR